MTFELENSVTSPSGLAETLIPSPTPSLLLGRETFDSSGEAE